MQPNRPYYQLPPTSNPQMYVQTQTYNPQLMQGQTILVGTPVILNQAQNLQYAYGAPLKDVEVVEASPVEEVSKDLSTSYEKIDDVPSDTQLKHQVSDEYLQQSQQMM
jgi:hypothetical protein